MWECRDCATRNADGVARCELCNAARPADAARPGEGGAPAGEPLWSVPSASPADGPSTASWDEPFSIPQPPPVPDTGPPASMPPGSMPPGSIPPGSMAHGGVATPPVSGPPSGLPPGSVPPAGPGFAPGAAPWPGAAAQNQWPAADAQHWPAAQGGPGQSWPAPTSGAPFPPGGGVQTGPPGGGFQAGLPGGGVQTGPPGGGFPAGPPGGGFPAGPPGGSFGPPPRGQATHARRAVVVIAVIVVIAVAFIGAYALGDKWLPSSNTKDDTAGPSAGATTPGGGSAAPASSAPQPRTSDPGQSPAAQPTAIGIVALDPGLDPARGPEVARVFDTFFGGINAKDYARAVSVYDPAGPVNPNNQSSVAKFAADVSTTTDDDIIVRSVVDDSTGKGVLQARVTFRSRQDPGKGPAGRESETCTRWDVTYILSRPADRYLIKGAARAGSTPC